MMRKIFYLALLAVQTVSAQTSPEHLKSMVQSLQQYQHNHLQEKVFVHLDRNFYVGGEIMWFKAYVVDGYLHQPMAMSTVLYLEVLDRRQQPVLQTKIELEQGRGNGSVIIPPSLDSDYYTVRAYTHWMKNFSADFFFHQQISVVNVFQRLDQKNLHPQKRIDAQFFPEGGHLVDGIRSKVAVRITDTSGKGISFSGSVVTRQGDTVVTFKPLKFGIGNFSFTPHRNEDYRVNIKHDDGSITTTSLPAIQPEGYVLAVTDSTASQLRITIRSKENANPVVYLIGHNRQIVKTAQVVTLRNGQSTVWLDKNDLGSGIVHFTLFDAQHQPMCERLYFMPPTPTFSLGMNTERPVYEPRNKVTLELLRNGLSPRPINASLTVFKYDSLLPSSPITLPTYLLLSSDLKGTIESPEYYFSTDAAVREATDNLMLTNGWRRFNWGNVFSPGSQPLRFLPEINGHIIEGSIQDNTTSKAKTGIAATLASPGKKIQPYFARSDHDGRVLFETEYLTGNRRIILQLQPQSDSHITVTTSFTPDTASIRLPHLKLSDQLGPTLTQRSISMQTEDMYYRGRVRDLAQPSDSSAFFGMPSEHYELDDYTRFHLMEEVMREYVRGVQVRTKNNRIQLKVMDARRNNPFDNDPLFLLDGVPVSNVDDIVAMDPLKIKSIDVVTNRYYHGTFYFDGIISLRTYDSDLGGFPIDPGMVILDFDGLQQRKEFYTPRYETLAERQSRMPDLRNLLLWLPDVTINKDNQRIDFYTSDQTGVFQAIIQGISQDGQPIYQSHTFEVKSGDH